MFGKGGKWTISDADLCDTSRISPMTEIAFVTPLRSTTSDWLCYGKHFLGFQFYLPLDEKR